MRVMCSMHPPAPHHGAVTFKMISSSGRAVCLDAVWLITRSVILSLICATGEGMAGGGFGHRLPR